MEHHLPEQINVDAEIKKYYQPLGNLPVSNDLYSKTLNFPIYESYDI